MNDDPDLRFACLSLAERRMPPSKKWSGKRARRVLALATAYADFVYGDYESARRIVSGEQPEAAAVLTLVKKVVE